jgi:FAD/FMN-containing dehydrogenase
MTEEITIWNGAVTHRPAAIQECGTVEDVRTAIRHARTHGLPLSVLGGGHDWAGRAIRPDGLVIDLRRMRSVTVDGGVAVIGGGATAADVITATSRDGLVAATGTVGAVGMAGLTLGGGYGPLNGVAGLALDNLLGAEVVLADGTVVVTDEDHEPDLFWALRGGGGNFGVVTAMRIRLHPFATVHAGAVLFPWAQAHDVLTGYADLASGAPDELTTQAGAISAPDGTPMFFVKPTWAADPEDGASWVKLIEGLGTPARSQVAPVPYIEPLRQGDQMFASDGRRYAVRTRTLDALTAPAMAALVTAGETRTSPLSAISMHHFHGAAGRVPVPATAFGLRQDHFMVEILASWRSDDTGKTHRRWADATDELLRPHALPGGYPNLLAAEAHDQISEAYGPNTSRLRAVKAAFDPYSLFTAIPLPPTP